MSYRQNDDERNHNIIFIGGSVSSESFVTVPITGTFDLDCGDRYFLIPSKITITRKNVFDE